VTEAYRQLPLGVETAKDCLSQSSDRRWKTCPICVEVAILQQRAPQHDLLTIAWREMADALDGMDYWLTQADIAWQQAEEKPVSEGSAEQRSAEPIFPIPVCSICGAAIRPFGNSALVGESAQPIPDGRHLDCLHVQMSDQPTRHPDGG
jgi:hypothetical protein